MNAYLTVIPSLCAALFVSNLASATPVTFQVNMSAQTALGTFHAATDSVFVAGDPLNAWSPSASQLTESAISPGVWVGTFDITAAPDTVVNYKFLITTPDSTVWEGNVGPGGGTGNRTFTLAAADQTLPVVFFNNVTNSTSVTEKVTFQVNMSMQIALGNFDPATGSVSLAGEFNNWSTSAFMLDRSTTDTNIWSGTLPLTGALNSFLSYKFVMNSGTWEGNVGANGAQNRSFTLTQADQILSAVYFNNLSATPTQVPVTFALNLSPQIARATFDPAADSVTVAGDFNAWDAAAAPLVRSSKNTNVWATTLDLTGATGTTLLYKFVLNGGTWEAGNNRTYTLTSTNSQTVATAFFEGVDNLGRLAMAPVSGRRITLSWTAGPLIRLQQAGVLSGGAWQTVAGSEGTGSSTVDLQPGPVFFRLVGP